MTRKIGFGVALNMGGDLNPEEPSNYLCINPWTGERAGGEFGAMTMSVPGLRLTFLVLLLAAASPVCEAAAQGQLVEYLGPKDGQTYVYSVSGDQNSDLKQVTVAGVAKSKNELLTCSPASATEYPDEVRKLGARPVVARVMVHDDAIVSTRGGNTTTLLKLPLAAHAAHWTNHQVATLRTARGERRSCVAAYRQ